MIDPPLLLKLPNALKYFGAIIFSLFTIFAIWWAFQSLDPHWHPRIVGRAGWINSLVYPLPPALRFLAILSILSPLAYFASFYIYIIIRDLPQVVLDETGVSAFSLLGTTKITWNEIEDISYRNEISSKGFRTSTFTVHRQLGKGFLGKFKSGIIINASWYDVADDKVLNFLKKYRADLVTKINLPETSVPTLMRKETQSLFSEPAITVDTKSWTG